MNEFLILLFRPCHPMMCLIVQKLQDFNEIIQPRQRRH
jgi:hypothetical protein